MSPRAQLVVGVLLGAALIAFVSRKVEWLVVVATLRDADLRDLLRGLGAVLAFIAVKTLRWRLLIQPFSRIGTWTLLPAVFAGSAGNSLIPHAGELVRIAVARRRVAVETSTLMGTIAIERMLDFATLLLIALVMLVPAGSMTGAARTAIWMVIALGGGMAIMALFAAFRSASILHWLEHGLAWLRPTLRQRILIEARKGIEGFLSLRQPHLMFVVLALSIVQWLLIAATILLSLRALDISVGWAAVTTVLLLSVVGSMLPTAPGYIGTIQAAFVLALTPFDITAVDAVSASILYNALIVVPIWLAVVPYLPDYLRAMADLRRSGET